MLNDWATVKVEVYSLERVTNVSRLDLLSTIEHVTTMPKLRKLDDLMHSEDWIQRPIGRTLKESSFKEFEHPKRHKDNWYWGFPDN